MRLRRLGLVLCAGALGMMAGPVLAQDAAGTVETKAAPRTRLLKTWDDSVMVNGVYEVRHIKLYFDYTEGVGRRLTYDGNGALLEAKAMIEGQPRPSGEEFAEAIAIVRADRILGGMLARVKAVPDGGFLLEEGEGKACGPRSRCLHVLWLSPDRVGLVRWTVVDLVKQSIAYRAYTAPENPPSLQEVSK